LAVTTIDSLANCPRNELLTELGAAWQQAARHVQSQLLASVRRKPHDQRRVLHGARGGGPIEASATFALFALPSGVMLGLWSKHTVEPTAPPSIGGSELAFTVDDANAVRAKHAEWSARGMPIAQSATQMDFGYTFVALDPDGYRLRRRRQTAELKTRARMESSPNGR
jgi:hypothetical protein